MTALYICRLKAVEFQKKLERLKSELFYSKVFDEIYWRSHAGWQRASLCIKSREVCRRFSGSILVGGGGGGDDGKVSDVRVILWHTTTPSELIWKPSHDESS